MSEKVLCRWQNKIEIFSFYHKNAGFVVAVVVVESLQTEPALQTPRPPKHTLLWSASAQFENGFANWAAVQRRFRVTEGRVRHSVRYK